MYEDKYTLHEDAGNAAPKCGESKFLTGFLSFYHFITRDQNLGALCAPLVILLFIGLLRFISLVRQPKRDILGFSKLYIMKLICLLATITASLVDLAFSLAQLSMGPPPSSSSLIGPAVLFFCNVFAIVFMYLEHSRGHRNCHQLSVYWIFSLLFYSIEVYALAEKTVEYSKFEQGHYYSFLTFFGLTFLNLILSLFNEPASEYKDVDDVDSDDSHLEMCPELNSSFLSRISFWWMNPVLIKGWKDSLSHESLWRLSKENTIENISEVFQKHWGNERKKKNPSIMKALGKSFGGHFFVGGLFKIGNDVLQFISPQILKLLICYTRDESIPSSYGYIYTIALLCIAIFQSFLLHQYFHRCFVSGMRCRGAVVSAVYQKSLIVGSETRSNVQQGEIVNLMSVDAQRFMDVMPYLHMVWSAPLQIALALYFLFETMGKATLMGLAVMILLIPLNGVIARLLRRLNRVQMKVKDERMKVINEILNGIRVIKLYAWEGSFLQTLMTARGEELKILRKLQNFSAATSFLWVSSPFLVSLATFGTYTTIMKQELTADKAFVALSLFNLLRFPLAMFPMMISYLVEVSISVERLFKFLMSPDLDDSNVARHMPEEYGDDCVRVVDASFGWDVLPKAEGEDQAAEVTGQDRDDAPLLQPADSNIRTNVILRDINFAVAKNSIVAVVGRVGCGKSSLCEALLGEMHKLCGDVYVQGNVAYVAQHAWIQNCTLRDNILFGKAYDHKRYQKTIEACALKPDLEMLPAGDLTEIGEKGINLSGGQKQRISIARAVYQDCDNYILDDPLSAVDTHVGKHIFDEVFGPAGILNGKSRILVTHKVDCLPNCDYIYVLKDGSISEHGHYDELKANQGDFSVFLEEHMNSAESESESESDDELIGDDRRRSSCISNKSIEEVPIKDQLKVQEQSKLMSTETTEHGNIKLEVFLTYGRSVGWLVIFIVMLFYLLSQMAQIFTNVWLSHWADSIDKHLDEHSPSYYLGFYALLGMSSSFGTMITSFVMALGSVNASRNLHNKMSLRIMKAPMSFFDTTPIGRIVNRMSKDIYTIDESLPNSVRSLLGTFFNVLGTIAIIGFATPIFLAVIAPLSVVYVVIQRFYVASSRQLKRLDSVSRSPIFAHFSETLNGTNTIRAYWSQNRFIQGNFAVLDYNQRAYFPSIASNRWLAVRLELIGNFIVFFASLFAVLARGKISASIVGLSLSHAMNVTQSLNWMVRMTSELETNIVAVERIDEYGQIEQERKTENETVPASWPSTGEVEFKDFSVSYREGLELVLKDISFKVKDGEKIGVVGRTGAGKSSLTMSLFRIIEPTRGTIYIDNVDIQNISLTTLRSTLTIIPQDPVLFLGSVRTNLDPFNQYTDDEIWNALEYCHLKSVVRDFPEQLEHEVKEGGQNFSVGQRQLICLGRALLRKSKILVLDEATAAVDLETDKLIQETIRSEFADCTIITIAHRLNSIMDSDRVMVLDQGRIAEYDTVDKLLEDPETIFYSMIKSARLLENPNTSVKQI